MAADRRRRPGWKECARATLVGRHRRDACREGLRACAHGRSGTKEITDVDRNLLDRKTIGRGLIVTLADQIAAQQGIAVEQAVGRYAGEACTARHRNEYESHRIPLWLLFLL